MTKYIFVTGGVVSALARASQLHRSAGCSKAGASKWPPKNSTRISTSTRAP